MRSSSRIAPPGGTPGHRICEPLARDGGHPLVSCRGALIALVIQRGITVKISKFARVLVLLGLAAPVLAQTDPRTTEKVIITGSSIKRVESEGSLPLQIFTRQDLQRAG